MRRPYFCWFRGAGGFVRWGDWSLSYRTGARHVLLSERYGTTRTWWLWRFSFRRHGQLTGVPSGR